MLYFILRRLLGVLLRTFWRPVVEGREHIPREGRVIVASNHLSFIDSILLPLVVTERRITFLAKSEYFTDRSLRNLPSRWFFTAMGAVPVPRGEARAAQASLDTALEILKREEAFGIYPEGTRSRDGRLYRGRVGVAWLAFAADAPVLPVGLIGTDKVQPVGARFPRIARVTVRFAPPIQPKEYAATAPGLARRQLTDDVIDAIGRLTGQERAPGYNELPAED
ncbi:lysophospholipid acyltransferase family protein [Motilibacter aurantiacus]|uniref:lysophospholipid acyltransferase family protein n=1 Tax=Motilibacter aurantiacus TaxID=2714955 RepID=UPI0014085175|nr:1-acyl-sn-glycerol-3-phosphate acyltransferase [Motilibacter aurantiacus]